MIDLVRSANETIVCTSLLYNVSYEVLLTVVRRQDRYFLGRITEQPHVHEHSNDVLRFG